VPELFTLDGLIAHLLAHREQHPAHGGYHIEMREHLLAAPPKNLTHDDHDAVVILLGIHHR